MEMKNKIKRSQRDAYSEKLLEFGEKDDNVVVLDADLSASTKTCVFQQRFPKRFFNVGIAEQNLMTMASGLALEGKICFASTFAMFATGRAWEQIRNTVCYNNLNVKIVATHAGITVGEDGASHQALEDVAIMRSIPNMTVISPCDFQETQKALEFALKKQGPVYIRLSRCDVADVFDKNYKFDPYTPVKLAEGEDGTVFSTGEMTSFALEAVKELKKSNLNLSLYHLSMLKPVCEEKIVSILKYNKNKPVFTIENHSTIGGLGSLLSEISCSYFPQNIIRFGVDDKFGQSGNVSDLLNYYGLTSDKLAIKIKGYLK